MPLPRFWYFPRGEKAVVVMTGDDHWQRRDRGPVRLGTRSVSPRRLLVDDWECVRSTSYMYPAHPLSDAGRGGLRGPGLRAQRPRQHGLLGLDARVASRATTPTSSRASRRTSRALPSPTTHRTHCIAWSDWATQPKVELTNGIRLDTNYYYWPEAWVLNRPGLFTGSGMPMRFADLDGSLIDVYQAATQMTDESGLDLRHAHQHAARQRHSARPATTASSRPTCTPTAAPTTDSGRSSTPPLAKGVPVVSARQMLTWLDGRNGSSFAEPGLERRHSSRSRSPVAPDRNGLQAMLPTQGANGSLQTLTRDGNPVRYTTQTIKGV